MGICRADLALFLGLIQFPGEGGELCAVPPWVDLQPDRQRSRSAVGGVEELMKRSDDSFGGLFHCREFRQLPGQSDVDARADVRCQQKLSCSSRLKFTVFGGANGNLAGAGHPLPVENDTKLEETRSARDSFRRCKRRVEDYPTSASLITDSKQRSLLITIVFS